MLKKNRCIISIGSNVGFPKNNINKAIDYIKANPALECINISNFFESIAQSKIKQDNFINCAVLIDTILTPFKLLQACQEIESLFNKKPELHWGPREIDLDIIMYLDNRQIMSKELTVPHPEIYNRDFVLKPMLDLVGDITLSNNKKISENLHDCSTRYIVNE